MKKMFVILFSLVFVFAFCFGLSAETEEFDVIAGQTFSWNDSSADARVWSKGRGVSSDGLWAYRIGWSGSYRALEYYYAGNYLDPRLEKIRVRNYGTTFCPSDFHDVVKAFTCPSGGTVEVTSVLTRHRGLWAPSLTGTSFCVYLGRELVFPIDGSPYVVLDTNEPYTFTFSIDVAKNQVLSFHIGSVNGNSISDSTDMTNEITYIAVNDRSVEPENEKEVTVPRPGYGGYPPPPVTDRNADSSTSTSVAPVFRGTPETRFPIVWVSIAAGIAVLVLGIVIAVVRGKRNK